MIRKNLFTILVSAGIFYLSMANSDTFEPVKLFTIPYFDKIVHFGMYFILMFTVLIEHRKNISGKRQIFAAAIFPLIYGILIEILQSFTISRSASFFDALADFAGIAVAIVAWNIFQKSRNKSFRLQ
ncbi:MAG TPA: VanZ family protein [Bacteroidales bacterium]|jgi:VanZ family protein|nr:VanZ family protein [Bacteroidales bacterium]